MKRLSSFLLLPLLFLILSVSNSAAHIETSSQNRLVVFEAFLRPACGLCQSAAPVIEQLAAEYAGQPVLFLEYNVDAAPSSRYGRWWAAHGGTGTVMLPLVMTGSGQQISNGSVPYYNTYKAMVEAERIRPPQAQLTAYYRRIGNRLQFDVRVTNLSNTVLSAWQNSATVHAVVYEEAQIGLTGRYVRQAVDFPISNALAPGATAHFLLMTDEIDAIDWHKIQSVVMVDYRPTIGGPYDMLQAVVPIPPPEFAVRPNPIVFLIDDSTGQGNSMQLSFQGAAWYDWEVSTAAAWLTFLPTAGNLVNPPFASVTVSSLTHGWLEDSVQFTVTNNTAGSFNEVVPVRVYYGPLTYLYLPLAQR